MIREIHPNNDPEEGGDYGHDEFLSLINLTELVNYVSRRLISHDDDIRRADASRIS